MNAFEIFAESISAPTAAIMAEFEAALNAAKAVLTDNPSAFVMETLDSEGCPFDNPPALEDVLAAMADVPCEAGTVKIQTRILSAFANGADAWISGHGHDTIHISRA